MDWVITIIKDAIDWLIPRMQVKFEIKVFDKYLIVRNISKRTAYNVNITASEETFWVFRYSKPIDFEPGRDFKIPFTLIAGHKPNGTIIISYTDKKNIKKEVKFPVTV
jgi:hypothetical protein